MPKRKTVDPMALLANLQEQVAMLAAKLSTEGSEETVPTADVPGTAINVTQALQGAKGDTLQVSNLTDAGADLHLRFSTPKLSKQGKSYVIAYGRHKAGNVVITATAYIPLGKDAGEVRRSLK